MPTLLRFSTGRDILSWGVCRKTGSKFAHVDFLLPDGQLLGAIPGKGVILRSPQPLHELRHAIFSVPVEGGWKYAFSQLGKPYDWGAIAGLALPFGRDWSNDGRWYCSELVFASLFKAGCRLFVRDTRSVVPRDILMSPILKYVDL